MTGSSAWTCSIPRRRSRRFGTDCRTPISSMPCVIPSAAPPTPVDHAQRFIERLGSAAKPRIPALALGRRTGNHRRGACWGGPALRRRALPLGRIQRWGMRSSDELTDRTSCSTASQAFQGRNGGLCSHAVPMLPQQDECCDGRPTAPGASMDSLAEALLPPPRRDHQGYGP